MAVKSAADIRVTGQQAVCFFNNQTFQRCYRLCTNEKYLIGERLGFRVSSSGQMTANRLCHVAAIGINVIA
jgi:hypothetical protein